MNFAPFSRNWQLLALVLRPPDFLLGAHVMSKKSERRLSLAVAASLIAGGVMLSAPAHAQINVPQAGTTAGGSVAVPSAMPRAVTVEQALKAPKDMEAVIEGHIVNRIKHEHYTFQDASGSIEIELDDKYLPTGQQITPQTLVRIFGEVDTHRMKPNDIDVKRIEIVK
ncbi:NirD/YgiW/YdeI family stress tolerance protein [Pandoraea commovens]|uniref:NirD/YgiW/YdeI family stress tolerance protein n=2 Tax=Pandoraea commovens TaxID=2508289 RepID=A0ABY5QC48_9BURK|nr:NirD/YgiW/YdeI family stress tolerance protein [Pandoraea commovens]UVA77498.1 NirD/YgiW/YdeI family stress tolerance protein [Pandoraea commovens]